jgi:redox-sensitive bicupin YhaK (pirin superfamily)
MIYIRKRNDRGKSHTGWLESHHTFSFGGYYDPHFMGYGDLRVINEDTVQPGYGFGLHPHKNMEIISYVIEGELEHKDSMGTGSVIRPGEIQRMSAGTGIEHSEINPSKKNLLHFLQIWIIPEKIGLEPSYEQKTIHPLKDQFILIGSPKGSDQAIRIHQDVKLYTAYLTSNGVIHYSLEVGRSAWVQIIKGKIEINNQILEKGDGATVQDERSIKIASLSDETELLFFDLSHEKE